MNLAKSWRRSVEGAPRPNPSVISWREGTGRDMGTGDLRKVSSVHFWRRPLTTEFKGTNESLVTVEVAAFIQLMMGLSLNLPRGM